MNASSVRPSARPLARLLVLLAALGLLALAAACSQGPETAKGPQAQQSGTAESGEDKLVLYACPMNDIPPLPAPGKCPVCGMELTPVIMGDTEPGAASRSRLDPDQMRLAGVRTAPVERRYVAATVQLYGQVEYDDAFISEILASTNGIVDKVYIRRVGEYIRTGQKLFDFYSSDIHDLENQLLDLVRLIPDYVGSQLGVPVNPALRGPAGPPPDEHVIQDAQRRFAVLRTRLRGFGLLDRDINQVLRLEQPPGLVTLRMPNLTSGVGGVVIANNAVQGAYVNKGALLVRVADPHFIWVRFDAFERDFPWLRINQDIEFTSPARPGEIFKSKITNIEPVFDEKNRTFRVGIGYNDYKALLRPSMSLRGKVKALVDKEGQPTMEGSAPERAPLVIPDTAPLVTGGRAVVYVAVDDKPGVFEGREIVLGPKADGTYVVLAGLTEGERVVDHGAFTIDSERQIRAKPSMLQPEELVRQQDFGLPVAPPPARLAPVSERPREPSPAPAFPPAEVFNANPSAVAAQPAPSPAGGLGQPGSSTRPPTAPQPGDGPSRDQQPATRPVGP